MATVEAPPRLQVRLHKGPFVNEPYVDFSKEENARKMRDAIEKVRGELGREYDLVIGGKHVKTNDKIRSLNPAKPSQVVGLHQKARLLKAGAGHRSRSVPACCFALETCCANANSNSWRG